MKDKNGCVIIPGGVQPWPHEERVAKILAAEGYKVEFLAKSTIRTADILLDGVEFEIKSPKTSSANTLEHLLKNGLKQSPNLIIDTSCTKMRDDKMRNFLITQMRKTKQIKKMLLVTKCGRIIDIFGLI